MVFKFIKEVGTNNGNIETVITELEKRYNITFPNVLKEYYSEYNEAKISLVIMNAKGYECEVAKIIPVTGDKLYFDKIVQSDRIDGFLPNTFYPLARDRGGNCYYWDCETYNVFLALSDDIDNPFCVAESVDEFMEMLNSGIFE